MRTILTLVLNTFKITFRKKGNIIIYLLLPLLGILFSLALYSGDDSTSVKIGLVDHDKSLLSSDFAAGLKTAEGYDLSFISEEEMNGKLFSQSLDAVVIIPQGYENSITQASHPGNSPLKMKLISLQGQETTVLLEHYINLYTGNLADLALASGGNPQSFLKMHEQYKDNALEVRQIKLEDRSTNKDITLQSLGFLIMFVMLGAGLTSHFILNEKKDRTYYRILSAPVSSRQYITANIAASLAIVAIQIVIILLALKHLFKIETFVPDLLLFAILLLFGLVAIGIGLITTAFTSSSYMAGTLSTLIITPTCMLGGCFWPVAIMPGYMQKISHLMPQWWALNAIQKMQSGDALNAICLNIIILLAFASALFLIAVYKFSHASNVKKFI